VKRKWLIWGIVILVTAIAVLILAERQRALHTVKYLNDLSSDNYDDAADAMEGLVTRGGKVVAPLCESLANPRDARLRWRAAEVLGEIGDRRALEPLIQAIKDQDPDVRAAAARALGEIRDPKAIEPLIAALGDEEPPVQIAAVLALGEFDDTSSVTPLIDLFQRSMPEAVAQSEAAETETGQTSAGTQEAERATEEQEAEGPPPDKRFEVREAVTRTLGRLAGRSPEALHAVEAALEDPHETVRTAACEALGNLGSKDATPLLVERLNDMSADVAMAAAWALGQIGDSSAREALKRATKPDRAYWVRMAANDALKRMKGD